MKKFLSIFAAIALMVACTKEDIDNNSDKQNLPQQQTPTIVISQDEYVVSAGGATIAVDVANNVTVKVELPSDVDWISENTSRATSANTFYFDIQPNEEYDQRTAEIKFTNKENGLSEIVKVVQTQKDALVVAKDSYTVSSDGDQIEIEVGHNVDFDIEIDCDWIIKMQNTRAYVTENLIFNIEKSPNNRKGTITFKSKDGAHAQTVTVYQITEDTIIISAKEIVLEPESGTFTVEINANMECTAYIYYCTNWIREIEQTRNITSHTLYYEYDINPTAEPRETYINIVNDETGDYETITIVQKGADISDDSYVLLGTGLWTDDIVASLFGLSVETYEVEVYENPNIPGFIYLKDLYTNAYVNILENIYEISKDNITPWDTASYVAIDISDPMAVKIPYQSIGLDLRYGEMSIFNLEPGTYENGVISFPTKGLAVQDDDGAYYANTSGLTKLNMPGNEVPENTYVLLGIGHWVDDIVSCVFGIDTPPPYPVKVYKNPNNPGFIYLKDLYTYAYQDALINNWGFTEEELAEHMEANWGEDIYVAINIADPTAVEVPGQYIGLDLGYGEMAIGSRQAGTLENGIISFPAKGLAIQDDDGAYYANNNGATKLYMPGTPVTDYTLRISYVDFQTTEDENLYRPIISATYGKDVAEIQYAFVKGYITSDKDENLIAALNDIKNGTIASNKVTTTFNYTTDDGLYKYEFVSTKAISSGIYTVIAIPYNEEGKAQYQEIAYTPFYLQGDGESPEVDLRLEWLPVSAVFPDYSDYYPDYSTLLCMMYGSEIKSMKYLINTTEVVDYYLSAGLTTQDMIDQAGKDYDPSYINADGADYIFFTDMPAETSFTLVVWAENIYGKTTILTTTGKTEAAPSSSNILTKPKALRGNFNRRQINFNPNKVIKLSSINNSINK